MYLKDKKEFLNFHITHFVFCVCINKINAYFFLIIEKTGKTGKRISLQVVLVTNLTHGVRLEFYI